MKENKNEKELKVGNTEIGTSRCIKDMKDEIVVKTVRNGRFNRNLSFNEKRKKVNYRRIKNYEKSGKKLDKNEKILMNTRIIKDLHYSEKLEEHERQKAEIG